MGNHHVRANDDDAPFAWHEVGHGRPVVLSFLNRQPSNETAVPLAHFNGDTNATAVRLEPADDARDLLPQLDRLALVEVAFHSFGDGRGYSSAQILREAGFTGELRAAGDVLVDQLAFMRRCGFDSFAPDAQLDVADVEAALARYSEVYQRTTDGRVPIWAKRHG